MAKRIAIVICLISIFCAPWCAGVKSAGETVWVATVQDTINPMVAEYLSQIIEKAEDQKVHAVIIELDTPGGLVESTRSIVQDIMNSRVPVITYVSPHGARAASAGMFITVASHVAAMAPVTNIGAAHPVSMGPGGPLNQGDDGQEDEDSDPDVDHDDTQTISVSANASGDVMEDKILNDMLAWSKTIAENRNRNVDWVIRAVKDSISSTETEALEAGVIDLICDSRNDLLEKLHNRVVDMGEKEITLSTDRAIVIEKDMTWRQAFLSVLINPTLAIYLMALGGLGLYYELSHPGFIVPGVIGGICMILGLFAMHTLPINYAGLLLILLAFVFFILEVKITSYGILTIGGITAFVLGSSMLVDAEVSGMRVSLLAILPLAISIATVTIILLGLVIKSHSKKVTTGEIGMIGMEGSVSRAIDPEGQVLVRGEIWRAQSVDGSAILDKVKVVVVKSDGLTLFVKRL